MNAFRKPLAFVRRDLASELSYRMSFIMQLAGIVFGVASFFFVSRLLGTAANPYLSSYGGDYFGFVLVGIAFIGFQSIGLSAFSGAISGAQSQGTLEAMLVTPTKLSTVVLSSSIWGFLWTTANVVVYLLVGLIFGAKLAHANVLTALVVLVLTAITFSGIGMLSASTIMVLKRGDPIGAVFGSVSAFLGGTYFPTTVFPGWLQAISRLFPIYYGLRAMRMAVLRGATLPQVSGDVAVLAAFAVVIMPISILAFRGAVGVAKADGTLGTY